MVMARTLGEVISRRWVPGGEGLLFPPGPSFLEKVTMSFARPVHQQQLPRVGSVVWLIVAMVFIMLVVVPGALTLLGLLVSKFIL
jgi:hypothetical protein